MVCRIVAGLFQGLAYPTMHAMIALWLPVTERGSLSTLIYTGSQVGTVLTLPLAGFLCSSDFLGGWPSVFYVIGAAGIVWSIVWWSLVYDSPEIHPRISRSELTYIREGLREGRTETKQRTPWKAILTSVPVWAVVLTHLGHNWGFYTLLTQLPTYFSTILGFDIKQNGLLSALPYLLQFIFASIAGFIFDRFFVRRGVAVNTVRKVATSIGLLGPAACLLGVIFAGCAPILSIGLFAGSMALDGCVFSGFVVTHVDMAPAFAGSLMGISNFVANLAGIGAPYVVGLLTRDEVSLERWSFIFLIAIGVYLVATGIFLFLGEARLQRWATSHEALATKEDDEGTEMSARKFSID